jgi:hypothetical protein
MMPIKENRKIPATTNRAGFGFRVEEMVLLQFFVSGITVIAWSVGLWYYPECLDSCMDSCIGINSSLDSSSALVMNETTAEFSGCNSGTSPATAEPMQFYRPYIDAASPLPVAKVVKYE